MTGRDVDISVDVEADISELLRASAEVDAFIAKFEALEDEIDIHVDFHGNEVIDDIARLTASVERLDGKDIDIRVDIDTAAAQVQLAALRASMATMQGPKIPILGSGGLGNNGPPSFLGGGLLGTLMSVGKIGVVLMMLPLIASGLQWLVGIFGALGVAIGVVAGGLLAFVSAIGVAAVGIGGFAALAIPTIMNLYDENAILTQSQRELKKQTDALAGAWGTLRKNLDERTVSTLSRGVQVLTTGLSFAEPILGRAIDATGTLFDNLNNSLQGDRMRTFFEYLDRSVGPITMNIGNGLGYMGQGVANLMVALEPLTNWTAQGFENMMERFADWGARMQNSERMQAFMDYTMENLPKIGAIIGNATDGIVDFFAAFDISASQGFDWMVEKMAEFAEWASNLDDNEDFQKMLERIKNDGPVVASIIGNISSNIADIIGVLSDFGRGEDGQNGFLAWLDKMTSKDFSLGDAFNWKDLVFGPFSTMFSDFEIDIDWAKVLKLDKIATTLASFNLGGILRRVLGGIFDLTDGDGNGSFKIKIDIPSFKWPELPRFSFPDLPKFSFPELPRFNWPSLPKFNWPSLPKFSWPSFPKFSWPSLPKMSISLTGMSKKLVEALGFSSGLGRVPTAEMPAIVHQNEAILQADNAQFLRDIGVLQGEGRNPTINRNALSAYGSAAYSTPSTTSVSNTSNSSAAHVDVGGIQIIVQGGNTNAETGQAVRGAVENVFASLKNVIPMNREG